MLLWNTIWATSSMLVAHHTFLKPDPTPACMAGRMPSVDKSVSALCQIMHNAHAALGGHGPNPFYTYRQMDPEKVR
jgi:hypothetical protein